MVKAIIRGGLLLLTAAMSLNAAEVADLFRQPSGVWTLTPDTMPEEWLQQVITWRDGNNRQLHYYFADTDTVLTVGGMPVMEAEFNFTDNKLILIELVLFCRDEEFNDGLTPEEVGNYLNGYTGAQPARLRELPLGQVLFRSADWALAEGQLSMVWALDRGETVYIKLTFSARPMDWTASLAVPVTTADLERERSRLTLPASRQGNRQYCTAATVERIFRYYASSMDQYLLAALFGVQTEAGAQVPELVAALNGLEPILRVRARVLYANPDYVDYEAILRFFDNYNAWARKLKQPEFNTSRIRRMSGARGRETLSRGLGELNRDVLQEMRSGNQTGENRFRQDIARYIDRGIPLMWTALVKGGDDLVAFHMMLIHGFDRDMDMVIYSDSADPVGGAKKMPAKEAWAVTNHLAVLLPPAAAKETEELPLEPALLLVPAAPR